MGTPERERDERDGSHESKTVGKSGTASPAAVWRMTAPTTIWTKTADVASTVHPKARLAPSPFEEIRRFSSSGRGRGEDGRAASSVPNVFEHMRAITAVRAKTISASAA